MSFWFFVKSNSYLAHPQFFSINEEWKSRSDTGRPACVLVYGKTVLRDFRTSERPGLGKSLGEASSANTALG